MKTNEFRISIVIEDKKTGDMTLLVVNDMPSSQVVLAEDSVAGLRGTASDSDMLPRGLEGTLTCSKVEWLNLKNEAVRQGVEWSQGMTKTKSPNPYWSAKPKVVVIHVDHEGIIDSRDPRLTLKEQNGVLRLWGSVEGKISRVVVRAARTGMTVSGELQSLMGGDDAPGEHSPPST